MGNLYSLDRAAHAMIRRWGKEPVLLKAAMLWLTLLAPLFFASYGLATWVTGQRHDVGTVVFNWESAIPFWSWSIVPYWTIDVLYALSLFLACSRRELNRHALRLLSAQLIAVTCFLLWPLRFTFERPESEGVFRWLFAMLARFDQPYNQAPSLHIALLVVLWVIYHRHTAGLWQWLIHAWFALIGISVLTTYQHHFIDVPTGALVGWLCVWLWPLDQPSPFSTAYRPCEPRNWRIALVYGAGALLISLPALLAPTALWLLWPAASFLMIALNYCWFGADGFQKATEGHLNTAVYWLLAPYLAGAWVNSRLWTRRHPQPDKIMGNVWLGRLASAKHLAPFSGVVDLCAELPLNPRGRRYRSIPVLDLTAPTVSQCRAAAQAIEDMRSAGPVLVCCALGYSRSATAVAAWLLHSGRADTVEAAIRVVQAARPQVVLHRAHRQALEAAYAD